MGHLHADQRGASALLVAASLVMLMGFAAIAVDSGLAYDERRQEQAAVDAGTLSAALRAQRLPTESGCAATGSLSRSSACNGAMVAIDVINENFDVAFAVADFADPIRCNDAAFPSEFRSGASPVIPITTSGTTLSCIRFTQNMQKIRILLPVTQVETSFGKVIGRDSIAVSAVAEAEHHLKPGESIFPFALGPTGAGSSHACLFSQSTSNLDAYPCNGPTEGNFGLLGPQLYGDTVRNTPTICNSASEADRIAASLAMGADHIFARDVDVPSIANDVAECPNSAQWIDQVDVRTGNLTGSMEDGLFYSKYGTEGRLRCKDGDTGEPTWHRVTLDSTACTDDKVNSAHPEELDDTPLWTFLTSDAKAGLAPTCASVNDKVEMEACLGAWDTWPDKGTLNLLSADIAASPRFGWVPILDADPGSGGSGFYMIEDFAPVYVQTIYLKCNASTCDVVFDPGETPQASCATPPTESCGWPSVGNKKVDALTAFLLEPEMLPPQLRDFPFAQDRIDINLSD